MFKDLWSRYPELQFFVHFLIGMVTCIALSVGIVSLISKPTGLYEVECWRGKEYTFHSVDIVWYVRTSSAHIRMQDTYGTEYYIVDSCSFKEARKEK